jgi:hypothetical protein
MPEPLDALFTDICLPGQIDGWAIAEHCRDADPKLPVVYGSAVASFFSLNNCIYVYAEGAWCSSGGAMLHKFSRGWVQDKAQITALLVTLLFFASFYLGFIL